MKAKGIQVDILVNDAGVGTYGKFATETAWEREKELVHLNVLTTTLMTKLFLKDMVERNEGRILQLASLVAITPFPLMAVYAATKAYIWNLTQSLNNELKGTNVTVTALMPNATDTNFFREADAPELNRRRHDRQAGDGSPRWLQRPDAGRRPKWCRVVSSTKRRK